MKIMPTLNRWVTRSLSVVYAHRIKSALLVGLMCFLYVGANLPTIQKDGRVEAFMQRWLGLSEQVPGVF